MSWLASRDTRSAFETTFGGKKLPVPTIRVNDMIDTGQKVEGTADRYCLHAHLKASPVHRIRQRDDDDENGMPGEQSAFHDNIIIIACYLPDRILPGCRPVAS